MAEAIRRLVAAGLALHGAVEAGGGRAKAFGRDVRVEPEE